MNRRSHNLLAAIAVGSLLLAAGGIARAAVIVQNSFETPDVPENEGFPGTTTPGYTASTDGTGGASAYSRLLDPTSSLYLGADNSDPITGGTPTGADGQQVARFFVNGGSPNASTLPFTATLTSNDSYAYTAGNAYALSAAVGDYDGIDGANLTYHLQLIDAATQNILAQSPTLKASDITAKTFATLATDPFIASTSGSLQIQLQIISNSPYFREGDFDNAILTSTPVPEPASLALLGFAGAAVLSRRNRA